MAVNPNEAPEGYEAVELRVYGQLGFAPFPCKRNSQK